MEVSESNKMEARQSRHNTYGYPFSRALALALRGLGTVGCEPSWMMEEYFLQELSGLVSCPLCSIALGRAPDPSKSLTWELGKSLWRPQVNERTQ